MRTALGSDDHLAAAALEGKDVTVLDWGEPADAIALLRASVMPGRPT